MRPEQSISVGAMGAELQHPTKGSREKGSNMLNLVDPIRRDLLSRRLPR